MRSWIMFLWLPACGLREWDGLLDTGDAFLVDCEGLSVEDCRLTDGCAVIRGRPLRDTTRGVCYDAQVPMEDLGCRRERADCGFALTFALDEGGDFWWFPDECIPVAFSAYLDQGPGDCD